MLRMWIPDAHVLALHEFDEQARPAFIKLVVGIRRIAVAVDTPTAFDDNVFGPARVDQVRRIKIAHASAPPKAWLQIEHAVALQDDRAAEKVAGRQLYGPATVAIAGINGLLDGSSIVCLASLRAPYAVI